MKNIIKEHASGLIVCIVVSLLLCIVGNFKGIDETNNKILGTGLLKITGDSLIDTMDTFQKQVVSNENLIIDPSSINLRGSDCPDSTTRTPGKIVVNTDSHFNAYMWSFKLKIPLSQIKEDGSYTFSCDIKTKNLNKSGLKCQFDFRGGSNNYFSYATCYIQPNKNNQWQHLHDTFVIKSNSHTGYLICLTSGGLGFGWTENYKNVEIEYRNFKLEKGVKATPYVE